MLQYPKTTHVTLPSVSDWGGASRKGMNILRDPPRSITTRRIDKAQQTMELAQLIDESGDRICEGINVYARGVDPMISVSYSNVGNNSGSVVQVGNNVVSSSANSGKLHISNAFLPYTIMDGGAFRPPVRTARDLNPLSHLNRSSYDIMSVPGFVDFAKSKYVPTTFRQIKDLLASKDVNTIKTQVREAPIEDNYKMSENINSKHINLHDIGSGIKTLKSFNRVVSDSIPDQHIKNTLQFETKSSNGQKPGVTFIGEMASPVLERNLPMRSAFSNIKGVAGTFQDNSSRDYRLPPSLIKESFLNNGSRPTFDREDLKVRTREVPSSDRIMREARLG